MALVYRGSVEKLVKSMSEDEIIDLLDKTEDVIKYVRGGSNESD